MHVFYGFVIGFGVGLVAGALGWYFLGATLHNAEVRFLAKLGKKQP